MAKEVKVGDALIDQRSQLKQVTQIDFTVMKGYYAPISQSGRVIVDGFIASCYVG